jgi:hypothetical protein
MRRWSVMVGLAAGGALAAGIATAGGIACMLAEVGLELSRAAGPASDSTVPVTAGGKAPRIGPETRLLRVDRMDPAPVAAGRQVLAPAMPAGETPAWLFVGEVAGDLAALDDALGLRAAAPRQVGGIGTCTLYTPCAKCRAGFEAAVALSANRPAMFSLRRAGAESIRAGQLLVAPAGTGDRPAPWVLVFESDRDILAIAQTAGFRRPAPPVAGSR